MPSCPRRYTIILELTVRDQALPIHLSAWHMDRGWVGVGVVDLVRIISDKQAHASDTTEEGMEIVSQSLNLTSKWHVFLA